MSGNTISSLTSGIILTPASGSVVTLNGNLVLRSSSNLRLFDSTNSNSIIINAPSTLTTTRSISIPDDTGNFVLTSANQTLTNKTLSGSNNTITDLPLNSAVTGVLPTANGGTGQISTAQFPNTGIIATTDDITADNLTGILATSKGGTGVNSTATFPSSGTVVTEDGSATLLNKQVSSTAAITGALTLPAGTEAERPTPVEGMVRLNTDTDSFEGYANGVWSGIGGGGTTDRITQASHGFVVGDVLYLNGATYTKAIATAANTAEVVGMVSRVIDASTFELTLSGEVSGLTGLTAGEAYFLSAATAGATTVTEPSTIGQVSVPIGVASSTTTMYVAPKRGVVVGGVNARTEVALTSGAVTNVQDVAGMTAGELEGWVFISSASPVRFYISAKFALSGAGGDYNLSYQTSGDTPPAGFLVDITTAGMIRVTLPAASGSTSVINFALNAPAIGASFPLTVDAGTILSGTLSAARLPEPTTYSDAEATRMGLKQYLHGTAYNGGIAPTVTCSQAGFSVIRAVFIPYQMQDFTWRLKFNFLAAYTAANISSLTVLVNGIITNNVTNQIISGSFGSPTSNATMRGCFTGAGDNTLVFNALSTGTTSVVGGSGDIELDSKPTWAY